MSERECGTCTACCEGWLRTPHIDMHPGKPCQHCTATGCAIYENRPTDPCRKFLCGWRQPDSPLPDNFRPDQSGVIVLLQQKWGTWSVIRAVPAGERVPQKSLQWLERYARSRKIPLLVKEYKLGEDGFVGVRTRAFATPEFAKAVRESGQPSLDFKDDLS
ncbi:MAG: hypothetical protein R3348_06355 [Xanthomonadales bacterium]|nr:hypothetical protein [Xanthomonadales bacterium]